MSKVTIELESTAVDEIVCQNLADALAGLRRDLQLRLDDLGPAVFSHDPKKDSRKIRRHIKALTRVLRYYGVSGL